MNKKFSTLMVGALLAGSFPLAAQNTHAGNGEVPYRTHIVKAANLDAGIFGVKKIDKSKWYQLVVNAPSINSNEETYVLTMERDYSTGHLYLAAKPIQEAVLSHSLWSIENDPQYTDGRHFVYTNKETGYTITFDHTNAALLADFKAATIQTDATVKDIKFINFNPETAIAKRLTPTILNGCQSSWGWYSSPEQNAANFGNKFVWSYFHNQADSVMAMALVKMPETIQGKNFQNEAGGYYVTAVKESKAVFGDVDRNGNDVPNLISLQPVVAGAKVLNADEINSMIDADGSYSSFAVATNDIPGYTRTDGALKGESVKFNVINPVDGEKLALYSNPFEAAYKAEASEFPSLARNQYVPTVKTIADKNVPAVPNIYAGYNIKFEKGGKYLMVTEKLFEGIPNTASYNALVVGDSTYDATGNAITALKARYHWKVTYYATNDSVVLEPLNASRMLVEELNAKTAFSSSKVSNDVPEHYFNTINQGVSYTDPYAEGQNGYINKAVGVPVALYAMNWGSGADSKKILTVGMPNQNNHELNKYAAASKFDFTELGYTDVPATAKLKVAGDNPAYVTNANSYKTIYSTAPLALSAAGGQMGWVDLQIGNQQPNTGYNVDYVSEMLLRIGFDNKYTSLQRSSKKDGLYHITIKVGQKNTKLTRENGMYLVYNMWGQLMYDSPSKYQNYLDMPATQWVVKQLPCDSIAGTTSYEINETPVVAIYNREYGNVNNPLFVGQLYQEPGTENYYIINHRDYNTTADNQGKFPTEELTCGDTIKFAQITDPAILKDTYHGYKHFTEEALDYETYAIKYLTADTYGDPTLAKYLNVDNNDAFLNVANSWDKDFEVDSIAQFGFGYTAGVKGLANLKRTVYTLKVRDNNLIDNNWKYVALVRNAINNNAYYKMVHLKDVDGVNIKLAKFYLKADQVSVDGKIAYSFVDATGIEPTADKKKEGWVSYTTYSADLTRTNADDFVHYDPRAFSGNGFKRLHVVDEEALVRFETLDNNPLTRVSAFVFEKADRPLYMPIGLDVTNGEMNTVTNIFRKRGNAGIGQATEYLFEDMANQSNVAEGSYFKDLGYLGITAEGVKPQGDGSTTALYVDSVINSHARMPQYLFMVDIDSVKDGRWCLTNQHGYFPSEKEANDEDASHHEFYNGYVAGRVLINLNDSVVKNTSINMLDEARKYAFRNYTRLAFVEGIHMLVKESEVANAFGVTKGEYLFILVDGLKLKDLTTKGGKYRDVIDAKKFKAELAKGRIQTNGLDGKHKNYAFSLRYTDDTHKDVLLESQNMKKEATIGTFSKASWVQIMDGVPVLAQSTNINGDHTAIDGNATLGQLVAQAQIFNLAATDETPTDNEDMSTSSVSVIAGNGIVTINGAAGKTVTISNVLGQSLVKSTATSDNATIAVPAGLVFVTVEGEAAVKAIVK